MVSDIQGMCTRHSLAESPDLPFLAGGSSGELCVVEAPEVVLEVPDEEVFEVVVSSSSSGGGILRFALFF